MPQPGDRYAQAFTVEPGQRWAIVHDSKLQANHCPESAAWTVRGVHRVATVGWVAWVCPNHLDGLTGLREFGGGAQRRLSGDAHAVHRRSQLPRRVLVPRPDVPNGTARP